MDHRRHHWLEKLQVQLTLAVILALSYFLLWPLLRGDDPTLPLVFLNTGAIGRLAMLAGGTVLLSALAALATVHSRPAAGLMAALLGLGGLSLRSESMRMLLWHRSTEMTPMFVGMIIETVVLALLVLLAAVVVGMVRGAVSMVRPTWVWQDPLQEPQDRRPASAGRAVAAAVRQTVGEALYDGLIAPRPGEWHFHRSPQQRRRLLGKQLSMTGASLAIALPLVMLLMQSTQRGQVLFGILAGMFLAVLIAHQLFPTSCSMLVWLVPMLVGVVVYLLGIVWSQPGQWHTVPPQAYGLPLDWMTAGAGGGLLGYWVSARLVELRHFETQTQTSKGT